MRIPTLCAAALACLLAAPLSRAAAAAGRPPSDQPAETPSAQAQPIQRPIELAVDATDAPRGIFHSRLVLPAAPGALTLAYPKWVQGEHAPSGPVMQVAGFTVQAGGRTLPWRRDPLDMFLVHVEVPAGARSRRRSTTSRPPSPSAATTASRRTRRRTS